MTPPAAITESDVQRMAGLARLGVTAEETTQLTRDLRGILDHFSAIQMLETATVPMAIDVSGRSSVARQDEVVADALCTPAVLLAAAPAVQRQQVQVHAVFG